MRDESREEWCKRMLACESQSSGIREHDMSPIKLTELQAHSSTQLQPVKQEMVMMRVAYILLSNPKNHLQNK